MATVAELKVKAAKMDIKGYRSMKKAELESAILDASRLGYMSAGERKLAYQKQNGSGRLTARQSRRVRHKLNRNGF